MALTAAAVAKAAAAVLTNDKARKTAGWVIVAILSPVIVVVALICSIFSGAAQQNVSTVELCFHGGAIPANASAEYRNCVSEM